MAADCRYLLVDGHSVIFHWSELNRLHAVKPNQARELLVSQLQQLHDCSDWRVTVVFDGKQGAQEKPQPNQVHVLYSRDGQSADSIIEKIVGQQSDRSRILVVTADEGERTTIEALGAHTAPPEWLKSEIAHYRTDLEQRMKRHSKK